MKHQYNETEIELGRRVAAAVMSVQLGVSLQTAYKRYAHIQPAPSWIEAGQALLRAALEGLGVEFGGFHFHVIKGGRDQE